MSLSEHKFLILGAVAASVGLFILVKNRISFPLGNKKRPIICRPCFYGIAKTSHNLRYVKS